jgi:hypothetical protein
MDYAALRAEIETGPLAAEIAPFRSAGNLDGVLGVLNDRRFTRTVDSYVNARRLMSLLGAPMAATILDKLDAAKASDARLKWALSFMVDGGLNLGDPETRTALDDLATANVITATERDAVKSLADVPASRAEILFGQQIALTDLWEALK